MPYSAFWSNRPLLLSAEVPLDPRFFNDFVADFLVFLISWAISVLNEDIHLLSLTERDMKGDGVRRTVIDGSFGQDFAANIRLSITALGIIDSNLASLKSILSLIAVCYQRFIPGRFSSNNHCVSVVTRSSALHHVRYFWFRSDFLACAIAARFPSFM